MFLCCGFKGILICLTKLLVKFEEFSKIGVGGRSQWPARAWSRRLLFFVCFTNPSSGVFARVPVPRSVRLRSAYGIEWSSKSIDNKNSQIARVPASWEGNPVDPERVVWSTGKLRLLQSVTLTEFVVRMQAEVALILKCELSLPYKIKVFLCFSRNGDILDKAHWIL